MAYSMQYAMTLSNCMPCSAQIISKLLPEIHKCKSAIFSNYNSFSINLILCYIQILTGVLSHVLATKIPIRRRGSVDWL